MFDTIQRTWAHDRSDWLDSPLNITSASIIKLSMPSLWLPQRSSDEEGVLQAKMGHFPLTNVSSSKLRTSLIALHRDLWNARLPSAMSAMGYVPRWGLRGLKPWKPYRDSHSRFQRLGRLWFFQELVYSHRLLFLVPSSADIQTAEKLVWRSHPITETMPTNKRGGINDKKESQPQAQIRMTNPLVVWIFIVGPIRTMRFLWCI